MILLRKDIVDENDVERMEDVRMSLAKHLQIIRQKTTLSKGMNISNHTHIHNMLL